MKRDTLLALSAAAVIGGLGLLFLASQTDACPEPELQPNFNVNQYLGIWYENARDAAILFEKGDCQVARYSGEDLDTLGQLTVINS